MLNPYVVFVRDGRLLITGILSERYAQELVRQHPESRKVIYAEDRVRAYAEGWTWFKGADR